MVGDREVDNFEDGEEIHFSRVISASGSSSYRLNGKEVPSCYKKCSRYLGYRGLIAELNYLLRPDWGCT